MISAEDKKRIEMVEQNIAPQSDDDSKKVGCLIVQNNGQKAVFGYNHFMIGVKKTKERQERPAKYQFMVHAEMAAIDSVLQSDFDPRKSTCYLNWFPCSSCFRALAYAGVVRLVVKEERMDHPAFKDDFVAVKEMAKDLGIKIDVYETVD